MIAKTDYIVLVGGSGFIGSAVAKKLVENGYSNVASLSRSRPKTQIAEVEYIEGVDITKPETLIKPLASATIVINFAGLVSFAQQDKKKLNKINAAGAQNIARACCVSPKIERLIHVSSTAALGFDEEKIDEEHVFDWSNYRYLSYSHSKYLANQEIDSCNLATNIIFPALVLGIGDKTNTGALFDYILNKKFVLSPPGNNSIVDVRDLADAIVLVMEKAPLNQNYIIASETHSFKEIFATIREILGQNTHIFVIPRFLTKFAFFVARILENWIPDLHAENVFLGFQQREHSAKKIRELGFEPKYSLGDSLREYWRDEARSTPPLS